MYRTAQARRDERLTAARHRLLRLNPNAVPSSPRGPISQAYATTTAVLREISYPQPLHFGGRFTKHLSPPPLGRIIVILTYWAILLAFLWTDVILTPSSPIYGYKWEKVAFRAAWISVSQVPLIYCLSCKFNVISLLTGISYERLNWLHRWSALTLFLTVIVHWSFFFEEWSIANFVSMELSMMPMVKYGFGAWSVVGWMVLSGWGFFRELNYELFVLQHIVAAYVLLWLLHTHVPAYATYNVWMAVGFVVLDRGARGIWFCYRNVHLMKLWACKNLASFDIGYKATLEPLEKDVTKIVIRDVDFSWKAGQHVYISIPSVRLIENHPFTIANVCTDATSDGSRTLELYIKAHAGFSGQLHRLASGQHRSIRQSFRTFVSGPWGTPPSLRLFETVVLTGSATGASFTVPILQSIASDPGCIRQVRFHWIIRHRSQLSWFQTRLIAAVQTGRQNGVKIELAVSVTSSEALTESIAPCECDIDPGAAEDSSLDEKCDEPLLYTKESESSSGDSDGKLKQQTRSATRQCCCVDADADTKISIGCRPSMDSMIRLPVEKAVGETAVVVCGGASLISATRTYVSSLSDERAVYKGTGARGIFLFTETFGW